MYEMSEHNKVKKNNQKSNHNDNNALLSKSSIFNSTEVVRNQMSYNPSFQYNMNPVIQNKTDEKRGMSFDSSNIIKGDSDSIIQRYGLNTEKVDLSDQSLQNEKVDQKNALESIQKEFQWKIGEKMVELGMLQLPASRHCYSKIFSFFMKDYYHPGNANETKIFVNIAMELIHELLPELLGYVPFENGLAAIKFAQEIIYNFLLQKPEVFTMDVNGIKQELKNHLEQVLINIKRTDTSEEEEEEMDQKEEIPKTDGKSDKRYLAALVRINKNRNVIKEQTEVEKQNLIYRNKKQEKFNNEMKTFRNRFKAFKEKASYKRIEERAKKLTDGYRFLYIINRYNRFPVDDKVYELRKVLGNLSPTSKIWTEWAEDFVNLKILTENETDLFLQISFFREHRKRYFMDYIDGEILNDKNERDKKIENAKKADIERINERKKEFEKEIEKQYADLEKKIAKNLLENLINKKLLKKELFTNIGEQIGNSSEIDATIRLLEIVCEVAKGNSFGDELLEQYEEYFAIIGLEPGNEKRYIVIEHLKDLKLLPKVDLEILKYGMKSNRSIERDAIKNGWVTRDEIEVGCKLLGSQSFYGILYSHMNRKKPGPLRALIERILANRELIKLAPPLTNNSLALDTNLVEALLTPLSQLKKEDRTMRVQLNQIIKDKDIKDIRLTNMNIAETGKFGQLIGTKKRVELSKDESKELMIFGVPYSYSRNSSRYEEVFREMRSKKVGENKGDADRSMMVDLYMADRKENEGGHFATADLGIADQIGGKDSQFNPQKYSLPNLEIHKIEHDKISPAIKSGEVKNEPKGNQIIKSGNRILDYQVGENHTVLELITWIKEKGYEIYIVGGAVRDDIREAVIHDVDMKTNMPVDTLEELLKEYSITVAVTQEIMLVKAGTGDNVVDIVSTSLSNPTESIIPLDKSADIRTRDFTLNTMYYEYDEEQKKLETIENIAGAKDDVKSGLLRFVSDPGKAKPFDERAKAILRQIEEHPEDFGRALKFLERGHKQWVSEYEKYLEKKKCSEQISIPKRRRRLNRKKRSNGKKRSNARRIQKVEINDFVSANVYHLEGKILDLLRKNAVHILRPIVTGDTAPDKKSLFLHRTGFQSPMELVSIMRRLNFPPQAIQMIYPDTVAGVLADNTLAYSQRIFPRNRATGSVENWDPTLAPQVKIDTVSGHIYQYRMYAYAMVNGRVEKLLIDIDYSNHAVKGHSAPHYHVFRIIDGKWNKKQSGYSNTGQPGEPSVSFKKGRREFKGPISWSWWNYSSENDDENKNLRKALENAGKRSCVTVELNDNSVCIGNQIKLPYSRIKQLHEQERVAKLFMLIKNLDQGIELNDNDDTLRELTGSGLYRERLRFKFQQEKAKKFIKDICRLNAVQLFGQEPKEDEWIRIFDLYNAGYSPEESQMASKFASKMMKNSEIKDVQVGQDVQSFVSLFEYYIASINNNVKYQNMINMYIETAKHVENNIVNTTGTVISDCSLDKDNCDLIKGSANNIKFLHTEAAVYHLHKHLDMLSVSIKDITIENNIKLAAEKYRNIISDTISKGTMKKMVNETEKTRSFHFEYENRIAIVELNMEEKKANLLTCYNYNMMSQTYISAMYLPVSTLETEKTKAVKNHGKLYVIDSKVYERQSIKSDGDCFFNSVILSAGLTHSVERLRHMAADELNNNYDSYKQFMTSMFDNKAQAIEFVRRRGNWNSEYGDFMPILLAKALNRSINVYAQSNGALIQSFGDGNESVSIFYNGSTHYEAAIER